MLAAHRSSSIFARATVFPGSGAPPAPLLVLPLHAPGLPEVPVQPSLEQVPFRSQEPLSPAPSPVGFFLTAVFVALRLAKAVGGTAAADAAAVAAAVSAAARQL